MYHTVQYCNVLHINEEKEEEEDEDEKVIVDENKKDKE